MIKNVLFDLGGVLIDWNPRYVYRNVFHTDDAVEYFLKHICTFEWNDHQDAGRTIAEATSSLIAQYPQYTLEIKMYYDRWVEMLGGAITPTVELLKKAIEAPQYKVYALTNWSAETWPKAVEIFEFLSWFDGVLVSGQEMMKKPDPKIFELSCERFGIIPHETLFIDDNANNIKTARNLGFETVHFTSTSMVDKCYQLLDLQ